MPDFIRCPVCRGCKTVRGFGHMLKKCSECAGIGYCAPKEDLKAAPKTPVIPLSTLNTTNIPDDNRPIITRKRGRPRKLESVHAV